MGKGRTKACGAKKQQKTGLAPRWKNGGKLANSKDKALQKTGPLGGHRVELSLSLEENVRPGSSRKVGTSDSDG